MDRVIGRATFGPHTKGAEKLSDAADPPAGPPSPNPFHKCRGVVLLHSDRVRYLAVGSFNTVFGWAVFTALQATLGRVAHYLVVLLVAHVVSVLVAFVGYRVLVFKVQGQVLRDLIRFWSVYLSVLVSNLVALPLLVELVGLPVVVAQGMFTVVTVAVSYVAHSRFSFRRPVEARSRPVETGTASDGAGC